MMLTGQRRCARIAWLLGASRLVLTATFTGGLDEGCCESCCSSDALESQGAGDVMERKLMQQPLYYSSQLQQTWRTHHEKLDYIEAEYEFGIVADLDLNSRDPQEFIWRSYLKKGRVVRLSSRPQRDRFTVNGLVISAELRRIEDVVWDEELELQSSTATRNRSMELSELVLFRRLLLAFCDYSGIAYKIDASTGKVFQRWVIADGNGNEPKPFKAEWAVIKDDHVWLGSIGFEWYGRSGEIVHRNAEWVKVIDFNGMIRNLDWHPVYQAVRTVTNTTLPGYLWHEAVEWEPLRRLWIMLPRFASNTSKYSPGHEHQDTTNMLIIADERFVNIQVKFLEHHEMGYGFTSIKRLPGSRHLFMVLRVKEAEETETQAAIIDLEGKFYTDPPYIQVGPRKYEGLAFL